MDHIYFSVINYSILIISLPKVQAKSGNLYFLKKRKKKLLKLTIWVVKTWQFFLKSSPKKFEDRKNI